MTTRGHRPRRTCLGCGERDEQSKLLRLVVGGQGELTVDKEGRGRGGYLHYAPSCWHAFLRRKSTYRAFHREISKDVKEQLIQYLKEAHGE